MRLKTEEALEKNGERLNKDLLWANRNTETAGEPIGRTEYC
jgi:hypothetical protein